MELIQFPARNHSVAAMPHEQLGNPEPDAGSPSRDEGDLATQDVLTEQVLVLLQAVVVMCRHYCVRVWLDLCACAL